MLSLLSANETAAMRREFRFLRELPEGKLKRAKLAKGIMADDAEIRCRVSDESVPTAENSC